MKKLYVIGNGFDLQHGIKSSYWDFRRYLEKYADEFLLKLEEIYGFYPFDDDHLDSKTIKRITKHKEADLYTYLWKSFEESLGKPNEDEIESVCYAAVESMKDIEFGDISGSLNHYFEAQFRFIAKLQKYVLMWAKQIRLHKVKVLKKSFQNNNIDLFLTFNYTPVLERIYGISSNQICHIHGGIPPYCSQKPILGHGNQDAIQKHLQWQNESINAFDEGNASVQKAFVNFFQRTLKDTNNALLINSYFFDQLQDVEEVIVIGHSIGDVDIPYFKEIIENIDSSTHWIVYYYDENERNPLEESIRKIGVTSISMESSSSFWN